MKSNKSVKAEEFLAMLEQHEGMLNVDHLTVKGALRVEPDKPEKLERFRISGITFIDHVNVEDLCGISLAFQNCNFNDGLHVENCGGNHLGIQSCQGQYISIWRCEFGGASIREVEAEGSIHISGLRLQVGLSFVNNRYKALELIHPTSDYTIKTPKVVTDDLLAMVQFRAAGIPVFISTAAAQQLLHKEVGEIPIGR